MKIGFIGFGEASSNIAEGLLTLTKTRVFAYDTDLVRAEKLITESSKLSSVSLCPDLKSLLCEVKIIIIAIPGKSDKALFESVCEIVETNNHNKYLFMDFCTATPQDKECISKMIEATGNLYVDVAVMGSVPLKKHKVPMYISGNGCNLMYDIFKECSMDITIIGDKAGYASIVKLCRSIYMKGLAALSIEMDDVCNAMGVKDTVYESLAKSFDHDEFNKYTPRLINGTITHLERRTNEVKECVELIKSIGQTPIMTNATLELYEKLSKNI